MSLVFELPGAPTIELHTLLVDVNGTLTDRGQLIDGVAEAIARLRHRCAIHLVSADTFGTLDGLGEALSVQATRVNSGTDKLDFANRVGATGCGVVGNGLNDALALRAAALGIVVLGPEGASPRALQEADIVCASIADALGLLADPRALAATIRP
jgi:soluble P-type ATPase